MAALERGGDTSKTGRFLITYKEGAAAAEMKRCRQEEACA